MALDLGYHVVSHFHLTSKNPPVISYLKLTLDQYKIFRTDMRGLQLEIP